MNVFTNFRLILNQTEFFLVQDQLKIRFGLVKKEWSEIDCLVCRTKFILSHMNIDLNKKFLFIHEHWFQQKNFHSYMIIDFNNFFLFIHEHWTKFSFSYMNIDKVFPSPMNIDKVFLSYMNIEKVFLLIHEHWTKFFLSHMNIDFNKVFPSYMNIDKVFPFIHEHWFEQSFSFHTWKKERKRKKDEDWFVTWTFSRNPSRWARHESNIKSICICSHYPAMRASISAEI